MIEHMDHDESFISSLKRSSSSDLTINLPPIPSIALSYDDLADLSLPARGENICQIKFKITARSVRINVRKNVRITV